MKQNGIDFETQVNIKDGIITKENIGHKVDIIIPAPSKYPINLDEKFEIVSIKSTTRDRILQDKYFINDKNITLTIITLDKKTSISDGFQHIQINPKLKNLTKWILSLSNK
jgi:hypothetical protein